MVGGGVRGVAGGIGGYLGSEYIAESLVKMLPTTAPPKTEDVLIGRTQVWLT